MSSSPDFTKDLLILGASPPEDCPYLPGRRASLLYSYPIFRSREGFDELLAHGYRRNGRLFYRPDCPSRCRECVPIRIPTATFLPSRSQRRLLRRVERLYDVRIEDPVFRQEHLELFNRHASHVAARDNDLSEEEYSGFLLESAVETRQIEYRVDGELVGVGYLDLGSISASSIYFFWDPDRGDLAPGTFSGLWEIEWCRRRGLEHYYLGYWIRGCRSMSYKTRFRPYELLDWQTLRWDFHRSMG